MTPNRTLTLTIKSAATFGRGDGVAGLVDREIEHDPAGFPFLRGKTLKGLLAESAENIVFARNYDKTWRDAKNALFGLGGAGLKERGILHVGDAQFPSALRAEVSKAIDKKELTPEDVLFSLTGIRRQTSINEHGAPDHATLRSMRVLLPGVALEASLSFDREPTEAELQLLAAAILDLRHAGTGRNRGRGWLQAELDDAPTTQKLFQAFGEAIR
jgi:CRISPR/Cas system CSM-associated protein Csm3 (group 7 of RAMP superfamily)